MSTNDFLTDRHKHVAVSLTWSMILSKCSDPVVHWYLFLIELANSCLWRLIFLLLGYERLCIWELFGMTDYWDVETYRNKLEKVTNLFMSCKMVGLFSDFSPNGMGLVPHTGHWFLFDGHDCRFAHFKLGRFHFGQEVIDIFKSIFDSLEKNQGY